MTAVPKLRLSRQTKDIELLLPFYRDGLGFEVLDRSENVDGMDTVLLGHKDWPYQASRKKTQRNQYIWRQRHIWP